MSVPDRGRQRRRRDRAVRPLRLGQAPLVFAALAFAGGIGLARLGWQPVSAILAAAALLTLAAVVGLLWAQRVAILPALAVWVALGMAAYEWRAPVAPGPGLAPFADGLARDVVGTVTRVRVLPPIERAATDADDVMPWERSEAEPADSGQETAVSVDLAVRKIERVTPDVSEMVPGTGTVRMTLYGAATPPGCGDRVGLSLRLKPLERFRDPGAWQYADYLQAQGIEARGSAAAASVVRLGREPPGWRCRLASAQSWAAARLQGYVASTANQGLPPALRLSGADAGMVGAMLFGDRTGLDRRLRTAFERTGSFHLFVVSGVHIALLAGAVFWSMRRLRAPEWLATVLTLPAAGLYAAFTGLGAPAVRSLAMIAVYLLARLLLRERDSLNALGIAVLLILVVQPDALFETGFQMTVLAVVAIAGLAHPLAQRALSGWAEAARAAFQARRGTLAPRTGQRRLMLELFGESLRELLGRPERSRVRLVPASLLRGACVVLELVLVGAVAEMVMVLPMAGYFHRATYFSLPANMVVIPLIGLLTPAAVLCFAGALVSPWLAMVPGAALGGMLHGVTWGVAHLSRAPGANVRVPGPVWWVGVLALVVWLAGCWAVRRARWGAWATALALPLVAAAVLWPEPMVRSPGVLEVTAIDVGQGDSLLVVGPQGRTMLIDAGGPIGSHGVSEIVSRFDGGEEVVSPYLWSRRVRRLDVAVLTHAHTDHMGGMPAILENFRPRELWVSIDPDSALYRQLLDEAARLGITVRHLHAGDRVSFGEIPVAVLAPAPAYRNSGPPKNDDSLVLALRYGRASALLEGDAEKPSEAAMLLAGEIGPVTLLKVGHHGSNTSSTADFLRAVQPREAVLSAGLGNPFGHPRGEVIDRFAALGTRLYRTDRMGLTTFLLGADGSIRERGP